MSSTLASSEGSTHEASGSLVVWEDSLMGARPRWAKEPDERAVEEVAKKQLAVPSATVHFLAQGGFNKLYTVSSSKGRNILRVALPVEPGHKTLSEVATLAFVAQHAPSTPVPRVVSFDATSNNPLGFEWMLLEELPGDTMEAAWRRLSLATKTTIAQRLAKLHADLFNSRFDKIGNLYPHSSTGSDATKITVGPVVSMEFFWGQRAKLGVRRGPFRSSLDFMTARLDVLEREQESIVRNETDEDEVEVAEEIVKLCRWMRPLLPKYFPTVSSEPTALCHDDLSAPNILVDDKGGLTGVIDWECVSLQPLWKVCQLPEVLEGPERPEEPDRSAYGNAVDGEPNELFAEHMREHEQHELRHVFLTEMERLAPEWVRERKSPSTAVKMDFDFAIRNADELLVRRTKRWLDSLEEGKQPLSLRKSV